MGPTIDVPDPFSGEMRVQLGRGDTRMSEQLLDHAQVGAALEQMGRKGVAEGVRADASGEAGTLCRLSHGGPCLLSGEASTTVTEE